MKNQESISRKEFLMKMGLRGAALMAVLTSCSTEDVAPSSSGGNLTIDLTSSANSALNTVGGYLKTGNVIVARIASGSTSTAFAAIARICPHEKKDKIRFETSKGQFRCTEHDWYFKTDGTGVGNGSITAYTVSLSGNMLTIS